ncbi:MAG: hypothetical protein VXZ82_03390 [Planctomycetota bacterium]|nr:hypothetical protein [Planctomycetota bacterium]
MWHDLTRKARESGKLILLGVIQEQHAERCRLYAQWKQYDWTMVQDATNRLDNSAVPIFVALDEAGTVVDTGLRPNELQAFLDRPAVKYLANAQLNPEKQINALAKQTASSTDPKAWQELAEQRLLWQGDSGLRQAIADFRAGIDVANEPPISAELHFGLGVALRKRFDSSLRKPDDFQNAVHAWDQALALNPNHYIYRRRIQQYGPRLMKPYPFYDWVELATAEIRKRGEEPIKLSVPPSGAEIALPSRAKLTVSNTASEPDPRDAIDRDRGILIANHSVVVPGKIKAGANLRVHLEWQPNKLAHWNNEAEPVAVWLDLPVDWAADNQLWTLPQPNEIESRETRRLEFELQSPQDAKSIMLQGYALYYVCEDVGGQCLYRRQDFSISVEVESSSR